MSTGIKKCCQEQIMSKWSFRKPRNARHIQGCHIWVAKLDSWKVSFLKDQPHCLTLFVVLSEVPFPLYFLLFYLTGHMPSLCLSVSNTTHSCPFLPLHRLYPLCEVPFLISPVSQHTSPFPGHSLSVTSSGKLSGPSGKIFLSYCVVLSSLYLHHPREMHSVSL